MNLLLLIHDASLQHLLQVLVEIIGVIGAELVDLADFRLLAFLQLSSADIVVGLIHAWAPCIESAETSVLRAPRACLCSSPSRVEGIEVSEISLKSKPVRCVFLVSVDWTAEWIDVVVVVSVVVPVRRCWERSASERIDSVFEREFSEEIFLFLLKFRFCFKREKLELDNFKSKSFSPSNVTTGAAASSSGNGSEIRNGSS